MRAALVDSDGNVVNIIVVHDTSFKLPGFETVELDDASRVSAGWTWDGEEFQAPTSEAP